MSLLVLNILWQVATLALVALGLAIVFGQLKIMSMAHGEFVMIGAYSSVMTSSLGLPIWFQLPVCLLVVCGLAFLIERLVVRHLYGRLFDSLLATWGIAILLRELVELVFGKGYRSVSSPISGSTDILGTAYPTYRLLVMVGITICFLLLWVWYQRSKTGTKIKAMVENPALARTMGINTGRLSSFTFVFGCGMAGVAGMVLAPTIRVEPFMGLDFLIKSFFALVVGGLGTLEGLGVGVVMIGGLQSLLASLMNQTFGYLFVLLLAIVFLWIRPNGIYSKN